MPADDIQQLFQNNRWWAESVEREDPAFFTRLASGQSPKYLWIGCSDSRVPATTVTGLKPGEVFVLRNVANQVQQNDASAMSVVDFAVGTLGVRHILVCGHYGCGGVRAAMEGSAKCTLGQWVSNIQELWNTHEHQLGNLDPDDAHARLCELNVRLQVRSLCQYASVRQAWEDGQALDIHGLIYALEDGRLRDLNLHVSSRTQADALR